MSEEEIIKRLKNIIEINKSFLGCDIQENSNIYKDIQGLLDLYNKEKIKNINLIEQLKEYEKELLEISQNYRELSFKYQARKDRTKQEMQIKHGDIEGIE